MSTARFPITSRWLMLSVTALQLAACGGDDEPATAAETYRPGATGEVVTVTLDGQDFTYEVIDGLAIVGGDIILGDADVVAERLADAAYTPQAAICAFDFLFGCGTWQDGVIGYTFADDWPAADVDMMHERIEAAIRHWQAETGFRFVERATGDHVVFRNSDGCSSWIGRVEITGDGPQHINLSTSCGTGSVIHEIGHAIGFWHEQARNDRGEFIRVNWDAVDNGKWFQFAKHSVLGRDIGPYDFGSIMHYSCDAFSRDGSNTLEPIVEGVTCANVGQRAGLSERDILGAYTIHPPSYEITGAADGEVSDRFELGLAFTSKTVRPDRVVWTVDDTVVGSGWDVTLRAGEHGGGQHRIAASVMVDGVAVASRALSLELRNEAPTVSLGPDRIVPVNKVAYVRATVSDLEDGSCPPAVCGYDWQPDLHAGGGATVGYTSSVIGPRVVTVTVTDSAGAIATDSVVLDFVNLVPVPVIATPRPGTSYSIGASGATIAPLSGLATDVNDGTLACDRLRWSSSMPSDSIDDPTSCTPHITFNEAGTRTIRLSATDSLGAIGRTSVEVAVNSCGSNCPPDASFVIDTPPDGQDTVRGYPIYYLTTPIAMTATVNDGDATPDNPIAFRWLADPPCFNPNGCGNDDILLSQGSLSDPVGPTPATTSFTWTPEDDIAQWTNCATPNYYLPYAIRLEVTDARGASNSYTTYVTLGCIFF